MKYRYLTALFMLSACTKLIPPCNCWQFQFYDKHGDLSSKIYQVEIKNKDFQKTFLIQKEDYYQDPEVKNMIKLYFPAGKYKMTIKWQNETCENKEYEHEQYIEFTEKTKKWIYHMYDLNIENSCM